MVAMFIMNGVSLLGIGLIVLSEAKDNISFGVFGATTIIAGLLILATFHYPRVLHYWKRQSDIDSDVSVYGNSIEMMKNKRTKNNYISSRIKRMSDGTLVIKKPENG